jgi:enolase
MPSIKSINSRKILNSRGEWTIETHVELDNGVIGVQSIPNGASKGLNEAVYVEPQRAVRLISTAINDALLGVDPANQKEVDTTLIDMDGTPNKSHLGGNTILSVSQACANASAIAQNINLYEHLYFLYTGKKYSEGSISSFPTPVFNILNGGKHSTNNLSFQEFMIIPAKDTPYNRALDIGVDVYQNLKKILEEQGIATQVGDEGGFAPTGLNPESALNYIRDAAKTKYKMGQEVFLGMDVAAESFFNVDRYEIKEESLVLSAKEMLEYYVKLLRGKEIIYLEDPFFEKDLEGWRLAFSQFSEKLLVVGDDLVVTNSKILERVAPMKLINAVIVKPNQVGTVSETLDFIKKAKEDNFQTIVSHRSGDTAEDTFIADLAYAVSADFMKAGAPVRGERVAKYNRLLEIYNGI